MLQAEVLASLRPVRQVHFSFQAAQLAMRCVEPMPNSFEACSCGCDFAGKFCNFAGKVCGRVTSCMDDLPPALALHIGDTLSSLLVFTGIYA